MTRTTTLLRTASVAVMTVAAVMLAGQSSITAVGSKTADLLVSSTVNSNCTITTTPVAFGAYDVLLTTPLDATGSVTITCTKGAATTIGLDPGLNFLLNRRMNLGTTDFLSYELYSESGRTTVWGNAAGSWLSPVAAPSKTARVFTVYGRIAAAQDVPAGDYADTVTATVNY